MTRVSPESIDRAVAVLRAGGLVAFPTETVYGLGADAENADAVRRIFLVKGRPADHPLVVHLGHPRQLDDWARQIPKAARTLAAAFWPGPLTLVLRRSPRARDVVTGGLDTIGLRVPGHPIALDLLHAFGGAIAAPSANRFGRVSPTCVTNEMEKQAWEYIHKIDDMGGMVAAIEKGFPQLEISDAAYKFQRQIDSAEKIMVGVNKYVSTEKESIPFLEIDDKIETEQIERLQAVRRKRDSKAAMKCLNDLKAACKKGENVMPYCIEAVKALCSVQEICDVYREVYGEYRDPGLY